MANEDRIQAQLTTQFPFLSDTLRMQRERRLFVACPYERFDEVFTYLIENMQFVMLTTMTGLDEGDLLSVYYHLSRRDGNLLSVKISVPKAAPRIVSIRSRFPAAELYERELVDLLGFTVTGLPEGPRYPLIDEWPEGQYPLRKEWNSSMLEEKKDADGRASLTTEEKA